MPPKVSDEEFIKILQETGSPKLASKIIGISERAVYMRRNKIMKSHNIDLPSFAAKQESISRLYIPENRRVMEYTLEDGEVFVASDAHYWPGEPSIAHQAFVELIKAHKPACVVMNGDVFDGARVSRHDPLYKHQTPSAKQEIDACRDRLDEIVNASVNSDRFWTFGNHDTRLYRYITAHAPEAEGISGIDIFDYFPNFHTCWRLDINGSTIIKHRWHNGVHATHNNAMKSLLNLSDGSAAFVTGHLHKLCVTPHRGIAGTIWGVDTGTLADPNGDQFAYLEHNPVIWASGFAVLTFKDGKLLPPELCEVVNGVAYFRGKPV